MRLCRFLLDGRPQAGFYDDTSVAPLASVGELYARQNGKPLLLPDTDNLLDILANDQPVRDTASQLHDWFQDQPENSIADICLAHEDVTLLLPVPNPPKLFLLAGNYADHIREDGGKYEERQNTFPYVFMKPPSTTLLDPCAGLQLPEASPHHIDWEAELACVIGQTAKDVPEESALEVVAGYTILNDISDRKYRPNPGRKTRDWDKFFDWMHGKWHDGFAPCGPCLVSSDEITDPQSLELRLELNGVVRQSATTRDQVFPVASVVSFISGLVTLEPGDIISTGTPAGVGSSTGTYLKPGDVLVAAISGIGSLTTRVIDPSEARTALNTGTDE